jgi:hypothetical protein
VNRIWTDPRDDKEWRVQATYLMPKMEPGDPIAMMGPEVPQRIQFSSDSETYWLIARLDDPINELPDTPMMALLDEAKKNG